MMHRVIRAHPRRSFARDSLQKWRLKHPVKGALRFFEFCPRNGMIWVSHGVERQPLLLQKVRFGDCGCISWAAIPHRAVFWATVKQWPTCHRGFTRSATRFSNHIISAFCIRPIQATLIASLPSLTRAGQTRNHVSRRIGV
jgi:hypothetical protein